MRETMEPEIRNPQSTSGNVELPRPTVAPLVLALGVTLLAAGAVLLALGNTQSKSAIPILIERAEGQKGYVSNDVCTALITLTHRSWCGGVGLAETLKKWRAWWEANAREVRIYAPDDCPDRSTMPNIW